MGKIDPRKISEKDLPLIALSDDRQGFLSWGIKSHSHGNYNHAMELHKPGYFASQDPVGFRKVPVEKYMKSRYFLKFWRIKTLSETERKDWLFTIETELNAPWMDDRYDYLGIIGQLFRIPWLNIPHLKYCSERVEGHVDPYLKVELPDHPSPSKLNTYFKGSFQMEVAGYWFMD